MTSASTSTGIFTDREFFQTAERRLCKRPYENQQRVVEEPTDASLFLVSGPGSTDRVVCEPRASRVKDLTALDGDAEDRELHGLRIPKLLRKVRDAGSSLRPLNRYEP